MFKFIERQIKKNKLRKKYETTILDYHKKIKTLESLITFYETFDCFGLVSEQNKNVMEDHVEELTSELCRLEAEAYSAQWELESL